MDNFIVSARKYRPQNFSTVIGQSHITTTLKNAITNNQLAHAFLFCGPRGVGKTTCARILAKTINCEKRTKDGEACNKCNSCTSFDNGSSFNIHELDAASNNSVDGIRELIDQVRFAPQAGKYKVYIVDEVHMLSQSAFNAFLKTLEEPPAHAIFILATTEKHKILPTILSRCQIFDFKRITINDTVEHLEEICKKEKISAEKTALHLIAQKSEGCLRDALSILDKIVSFTNGKLTYANTLEHLNILDEDYFFKFISFMQEAKLADAMLLFDEINQKGFEGDTLLDGFAEFIRNLLVCKDPRASKLLEVAEDFKPRYLEVAGNTDTGWLISALNIIGESVLNYKQSRNKKLHIELFLVKMTYLHQALKISMNEDSLSKKKLIDSVKAVNFRALPVVPFIETKKASAEKKESQTAVLMVEEPKLVIEKKPAIQPKETPSIESKPAGKLTSLNKIREKVAVLNNVNIENKVLTVDSLNEAWKMFIESLAEKKNHSAVTNFKMAEIKMTDELSFDIITENNIQYRFVESERAQLINHLHGFFNNKSIKYQLLLEEKESGPVERPLNSKEIFIKMSEQYPLLKELKEKLRLDIEF